MCINISPKIYIYLSPHRMNAGRKLRYNDYYSLNWALPRFTIQRNLYIIMYISSYNKITNVLLSCCMLQPKDTMYYSQLYRHFSIARRLHQHAILEELHRPSLLRQKLWIAS